MIQSWHKSKLGNEANGLATIPGLLTPGSLKTKVARWRMFFHMTFAEWFIATVVIGLALTLRHGTMESVNTIIETLTLFFT